MKTCHRLGFLGNRFLDGDYPADVLLGSALGMDPYGSEGKEARVNRDTRKSLMYSQWKAQAG